MDELQTLEKAKYEKVWTKPEYRIHCPGLATAPHYLQHIQKMIQEGEVVIDFGCGTGLAALVFLDAGLKVSMVDIAENCLGENIRNLIHLMPEALKFTRACLWDLPIEFPVGDWIYSTDVLEHIPEEKIEAVLSMMASKTRKGGAIQIFTVQDDMGEIVGEVLHLTVRPLSWWREKVASYFKIEAIVEIIPAVRYSFYVVPKSV